MARPLAVDQLSGLLDAQRAAFAAEGEVTLATRIDRIDRCIGLLVDHQDALCAAVDADFGGRSAHVTRMSDLMTSVLTLKFVRKNIKRWMRPQRRKMLFPLGLLGGKARLHYQPKGVVGIMSPWNVPINLVFGPLADALGAGNRAMLKPSEITSQTAELLQSLLQRYFDPTEVAVVTGDAEVGAAFSALPFDHLVFTGSGHIGAKVMAAAAPNLTPVTLELGGKSPVVISETADPAVAAERVMRFKTLNAGQICLSPDVCYVPENRVEDWLAACSESLTRLYPIVRDNPDYTAMVDTRNFNRVRGYLDEARDRGTRIEVSESDWCEAADRRIPVHLLVAPAAGLKVMREELFGPAMCVQPYRDLDACIEDINARPRPLALYYFGTDRDEQTALLNQTRSGGVVFNDLGIHFACDDLPFGGIGASGMGHYHGREGFAQFSHARAVVHAPRMDLARLAGTLPPYGDKLEKLLKKMIRR